MEEKKTKGRNFTNQEKHILLQVVEKYKNVIENKKTNASSNSRKQEVWIAVEEEFNSTSLEPRKADQLKNFYKNLKHKTRQDIADINKQKYLESVSEDDIAVYKKQKRVDKVEMEKTGGGQYTPLLSEEGARVLAIVGDQFEPLENPFDSAASFHKLIAAENLQNSTKPMQVPLPSTSKDSTDSNLSTSSIQRQTRFTRHKHTDAENKKLEILELEKDYRTQKIKYAKIQHEIAMKIKALEKEYWQKKLDSLLNDFN